MKFYPEDGLIGLNDPAENESQLLMAIALLAAEAATAVIGKHRLAVHELHPAEVVDAIFINSDDRLEVRLPTFAGVPLNLTVTPLPGSPVVYKIKAGFRLEAIAPLLPAVCQDYAAWLADQPTIVVND